MLPPNSLSQATRTVCRGGPACPPFEFSVCRAAKKRRLSMHIGLLHGIQHAPQHLQLELQDCQGPPLLFAALKVVQGNRQTMTDIGPGLGQASAKVIVPLRFDPRIVVWPVIQPALMDLGSKEFCQGSTGRFLPGGGPSKV